MADTLSLYNAVRSVPDDAKKPIAAGRLKGKTDINPMWRIKTLTEQFGPCGIGWYYKPVKKWIEVCGDEAAAFVDIELYVKDNDGNWSMPISGTGGSMFAAKEKSGIYVSDECYKMATTDAISVACKQLGFGADVYWSSDRTKYDQTQAPAQPRAVLVGNEHVNVLFMELRRTGVGMNGILKNYGLSDIHEMSIDQFKDAMGKLKKYPDKPLDPATIPPDDMDDGLPWNTPAR